MDLILLMGIWFCSLVHILNAKMKYLVFNDVRYFYRCSHADCSMHQHLYFSYLKYMGHANTLSNESLTHKAGAGAAEHAHRASMTQRQMLTLLICFAHLSKIVIAVVNENNTGFIYGSRRKWRIGAIWRGLVPGESSIHGVREHKISQWGAAKGRWQLQRRWQEMGWNGMVLWTLAN